MFTGDSHATLKKLYQTFARFRVKESSFKSDERLKRL